MVSYADSRLEKLAIREKYFGNNQVHTAASGGRMNIHDIGQASISSPIDVPLKDVLHVPQANKNLASMSRLTTHNNVFFETHPKYYFYKGLGNEETPPSR